MGWMIIDLAVNLMPLPVGQHYIYCRYKRMAGRWLSSGQRLTHCTPIGYNIVHDLGHLMTEVQLNILVLFQLDSLQYTKLVRLDWSPSSCEWPVPKLLPLV